MEQGFYVCNGCELALHLLGPFERPCPNCGGDFILTDERSYYAPPIHHPSQAVQREDLVIETKKEWAARIAAENIDGIIESFEKLLAQKLA
jgi:hypothetical protein